MPSDGQIASSAYVAQTRQRDAQDRGAVEPAEAMSDAQKKRRFFLWSKSHQRCVQTATLGIRTHQRQNFLPMSHSFESGPTYAAAAARRAGIFSSAAGAFLPRPPLTRPPPTLPPTPRPLPTLALSLPSSHILAGDRDCIFVFLFLRFGECLTDTAYDSRTIATTTRSTRLIQLVTRKNDYGGRGIYDCGEGKQALRPWQSRYARLFSIRIAFT